MEVKEVISATGLTVERTGLEPVILVFVVILPVTVIPILNCPAVNEFVSLLEKVRGVVPSRTVIVA